MPWRTTSHRAIRRQQHRGHAPWALPSVPPRHRPPRHRPAHAFADVDVFVDEVLQELAGVAKDGTRPQRRGPKLALSGGADFLDDEALEAATEDRNERDPNLPAATRRTTPAPSARPVRPPAPGQVDPCAPPPPPASLHAEECPEMPQSELIQQLRAARVVPVVRTASARPRRHRRGLAAGSRHPHLRDHHDHPQRRRPDRPAVAAIRTC